MTINEYRDFIVYRAKRKVKLTPSRNGARSTADDYCYRIENRVCVEENCTLDELAANIDAIVKIYGKNGAKQHIGDESNTAVISALKKLQEYYRSDVFNETRQRGTLIVDRKKVIFVNLTEMLEYKGNEPGRVVKGGGEYVDINGYGHELFNFKPDGGKFYGYAPKGSTTDIRRIAPNEIREDEHGQKYIDNVLVIFTATRDGSRIIVGYYKHARVYGRAIESQALTRFIKDDQFAAYNIVCDIENGKLLEYDDRTKHIPYSKKDGYGFGQSSLWYADGSSAVEQESRKGLLDYIEDIINEVQAFNKTNDERKYGSFDESERSRVTIEVAKRSRAARQACLDLKGYSCVVCGFNFEEIFGEAGKGYIEVHHVESVTTMPLRDGYAGTNPETDLVPVCSNCHSILHKVRPAYSIEAVKAMRNRDRLGL